MIQARNNFVLHTCCKEFCYSIFIESSNYAAAIFFFSVEMNRTHYSDYDDMHGLWQLFLQIYKVIL